MEKRNFTQTVKHQILKSGFSFAKIVFKSIWMA